MYREPFERNSVRVKDLCHDYVQTVLDFDATELPHEFIYVDEAGFNLAKTKRQARNVVGQWAVVNVPGQRSGNITLCAAISVQGDLHHHATLGPYNTGQIIAFLDALHAVVQDRPEQPRTQLSTMMENIEHILEENRVEFFSTETFLEVQMKKFATDTFTVTRVDAGHGDQLEETIENLIELQRFLLKGEILDSSTYHRKVRRVSPNFIIKVCSQYLYILSINIHRGRRAIDSPVVVHSVDGEVLPRRV
ncbi:insertion element IS630 putative 39 kDa -like protein [Labeo rohita]|uniref:Insertion element IS630 putative 39 kDa-like protein n=1 Tax=Labeo rohita TaxID=84645 RepID=A0A498M306_LABRO|nr:insertion element IS630 putative 39 kDa -like protein [Labeo rohita]